MSLNIKHTITGHTIVVEVSGALDAHNAPDFEKQVNTLLQGQQGHLILNLAGVNHIASAGFGALMPIKNIQDARKHKMLLCNLNENVAKVFKLLGFNNILQAYASVEEAKKAI